MEKDFKSWFHDQYSDRQLPSLTSFGYPFNLGQQSTVPAYMNLCRTKLSGNGTLPMFALSAQPDSNTNQLNEPRGWSNGLPRFCQDFAPVLNSAPKEKLPSNLNENCEVTGAPDSGRCGCPLKRYLVFDQSGDQTTLIFSSGIGTPGQYLNSWNPKPLCAYEFNKEVPGTKRNATDPYGTFPTNEYDEENPRDDIGSEMHEDTEELDALLDSDDEYGDSDDDDDDDDDETSTGHSPSALTAYNKQELFDDNGEEVASSAGPMKRQKLLDGGGYDVLSSLMDTASSVKNNRCFEYEDDAESSCGDGKLGSLSGNKRSRKEKIRETVRILESIIPGGKGKDAVFVIDGAINYLRSLKLKAKALGLDNP